MKPTLVMLHTVVPLIEMFDQLGNSRLPGVRRMHVLDEPLLERVRQHGTATEMDLHALQEHLQVAVDISAAGVLVTCSTLSPVVDRLARDLPIPIFRIDDRLVQQIVAHGPRVGVVATAESTLAPTRQRILDHASKTGKPVELQMVLVEGAFAAFQSGAFETHDRLVWQEVTQLASRVDAVALAQASMARILLNPPAQAVEVPLLTSPHLAMEQVREVFEAKGLLQ